ncbi:tetratricopeptide repeat protein, partial [Elusimicrobiota bacterium]
DDEVEITEGIVKGKFTLLKILPQKYKTFIILYEKYLEKNKKKWAKDIILEAAKRYPDEIEVYAKLGKVYEMLEHYGFAIDAYLAGLEREKGNEDLRYYLALSYEKLFEESGKDMYRMKAKEQWVLLMDDKKYKKEAQEYLKR